MASSENPKEKPIHLRRPTDLHRTECGIPLGDSPFLIDFATTALVDVTCRDCIGNVAFIYERVCELEKEMEKKRKVSRRSFGGYYG